jgi:acyl carrier protein
MKRDTFYRELEEILEIEDEKLSDKTDLKDMIHFEFDSMAIMILVAFIHDKFNKKFTAVQINKVTTVQSLMELIGIDNFDQ